MAKDSSQEFIARNRTPHVQIEYYVELRDAEKKIQLPFVMGVMANLSGNPAEPLPDVADRKFLDIDIDNFDRRLKSMKPRAAFQVQNTLTGDGNLVVDITFESMDDFSPAAVARKVDALSKLLEARQELAALVTYMDGTSGAEQLIRQLLQDPALLKAIAAFEPSELQTLLNKEFKPRSDAAKKAVETAVRTLAEQALAQTTLISADTIGTIEAMIAALDRKLSEQVNLIMHHKAFQEIESAWRGLNYLVTNTETDEMLKIRVLNISKADLGRTLKRYKGVASDQSPVFKKLEAEYGQFGGEPFGCLVGDYYFDHTPPDVELAGQVAQVAAASHCPFIAGVSPTVMQMESWQELANPRDLTKISTTAEYAPWRSLRESEASRYLGLAMPRFLGRYPYGKANPVEEFDFQEDTEGAKHDKFAWVNSAYAMGVNITRSFKMYGWFSRIRGAESGGAVEGLPIHTFPTDDGGIDMKCPTEIAISDRREAELAKNGFMPLLHRKNTDLAAFIGAQSLQKPFEYTDPDATSNANLSARLPYVFAACRFAHYLKCIVRDKIGSFKERNEMEAWLNKWISQYVLSNPASAGEETKAKYPLSAAEVTVEEIEGNPGYYSAKFYLRPRYQLEGLTVSLRLVSKLPSAKGGK